MAFEAGTVYVPIVPSLRGFQRTIAREVQGTGQGIGRGLGRQIGEQAGKETRRSLSDSLSGLNTAVNRIGVGVGAALAAALTKAAAPAVAAIAAVPSAMAAATVAVNTLRVGLFGVGDAMSALAEGDAEELNEALEKLAPNARAFVQQAAAMKDEVVGLRNAVQNRLFAGLDSDLRQLGANLLPTARDGMVGVAGALNGLAREAVKAASTPWFRGQVNQVFAGTTSILQTLRGAVAPLIDTVVRLTVAGLPLVQRMTQWVVQGIRVVAEWVRLKQETGALQSTLTGIGDTLAQLGRIGGNVALTIARLSGQTSAFGDAGGSILDTLERLTAQMAAWSATAEGQRTAAALFQTLGQAAAQLGQALPLLLSPLGLIVKVLAALPAPVRDVVGQMLGWALIIGVIANRLRLLAGITTAYTVATRTATGAAAVFRATLGATGVAGFVTGLRNVNAAMAANATTATRLGAALRSQILLWRQQAAAAGVSTARIIAQAAAQRVAAVATRVWAAAQAVFNAVMSANPLVLVGLAIAALVAAVVLAYQRFAWFRALVDTVWAAIKTAFMTAWTVIRPVLVQIGHWLSVVLVTAFQWLAATARTVWTGITMAVAFAWNLLRPVFSTIATVLRAVLGVAFIVLSNTVKIVWIAIQLQIKAAWAVIRVVFAALRAFVANVLGPVFRWLWNNIVKPVWNSIRSHISTVWAGIRTIWNALRSYLSGPLSTAFRTARSVIQTVWNAVRNTISTVYNNGIRPTFDKLRSAVGRVRDAFKTAVNGIRKIWDGLRDATKKPVNFVIGIYNDGIVRLVNKIADVAGLKTRLDRIPKFAAGGVLPGYAPGVDRLLALVSPGEGILRPEATRALGEGFIYKINAVARKSGVEGVRRWLTGRDAIGGEGMAFARGGVVPRFAGAFKFGGIVGRFVEGVKNFTIGNVGRAARGLLDKILGGPVPGAGIIRDVVAQIPVWIKDNILKWIKSKIDSGVGGPAIQRALRFARAQAGKPYVWGGVGPGGYDCSGFMSAITNVIQGRSPYSRRFTTFSFTGATRGPAGFVRNLRSGFVVGITNAGVGHMAGTLGGVNVESRGSAGVVVGPRARGASDGLFSMRYGLKFDRGGLLPQGLTLAYHGSRQPDRVLTDSQWQAIYAAARGGDGPTTTYNVYPRQAVMTVEDLDRLTRVQNARARVGRPR